MTNLSTYQSICLSTCLSTFLTTYLYIHTSIYTSMYTYIHLFKHPGTCLLSGHPYVSHISVCAKQIICLRQADYLSACQVVTWSLHWSVDPATDRPHPCIYLSVCWLSICLYLFISRQTTGSSVLILGHPHLSTTLPASFSFLC